MGPTSWNRVIMWLPAQLMKVTVIIPVYNEFRTLRQVLERVRRAPLPSGITKEIIVIDDGSTDGTAQVHQRRGAGGNCGGPLLA